ncbi:hypothetical protein ACRAWF_14360 [Streptomyces sp. L7]
MAKAMSASCGGTAATPRGPALPRPGPRHPSRRPAPAAPSPCGRAARSPSSRATRRRRQLGGPLRRRGPQTQGSAVVQVAAVYLQGRPPGTHQPTGRGDRRPRRGTPTPRPGRRVRRRPAPGPALRCPSRTLLRGEFERGREVADEVRTASRKQGEYWCGAFADYLIAQADLAHGDIQAAVLGARTSIAGHALLHNTVGAAMSLDLLAAAVVTAGDAHRAARLLGIGTRLWELTGRAQMDSPDLIATRRTCELRVRERLGEDAYTDSATGRAWR